MSSKIKYKLASFKARVTGLLCQFAVHCTYITSNYYSSPSVVLASSRPDGSRNIIDDYRPGSSNFNSKFNLFNS